MPRLLLVDDNPSIHKIAETLLAPTDIQLVCAESAKDALNLIAQGECFDVALLDTVMADMDGWALLDQLRMHPATAGMPIAMMAGVLDTVDPARLENAPIQGFLKKPVELRDLGTRIHTFLEAPVAAVPPPAAPIQDFSPFSTLPAVKLADLPEFRGASVLQPAVEPDPEPEPQSDPEAEAEPIEDDLLLLVEADLWPEVPPPPGTVTEDLSPFAELPPEESLDLEELDLDSLKGLTIEPKAAAEPEAVLPEAVEPEPTPAEAELSLPSPEPAVEPEPELDLELESPAPVEPTPEEMASIPTQILPDAPADQELPDLGPETEPTFDPSALAGLDSLSDEAFEPRPTRDLAPEPPVPDPDFLSGLGEASITPGVAVVNWSDESEKMLGYLTPSQPLAAHPVLDGAEDEDELDLGELDTLQAPTPTAGFPLAEPLVEPWTADEPEAPAAASSFLEPAPEPVPVPVPQTPPAPNAAAVPTVTNELLRALTSDPALMDHLAKALVARLGDQVLREIAWEVMPEMAERLNRH